jgi:hypothetical protein
MRPIEAHRKSWNGRTLARPELTIAARATIAPMIPIKAQNIHPGKNAPNRVNDGAPLRTDPFAAVIGTVTEMSATMLAGAPRPKCLRMICLDLIPDDKGALPMRRLSRNRRGTHQS